MARECLKYLTWLLQFQDVFTYTCICDRQCVNPHSRVLVCASLLVMFIQFSLPGLDDDHVISCWCQALHVLLASASYMTDDVQLVPMVTANLSDIGASSFDKSDWTFLFHDLKVFEESVGSLKKSRAQFVMHVLRDASPYMSSTIFPEIMIVVLSFTETCLRRTFEMPKHFLGAFMVLDNIWWLFIQL